MTKVSLHLEPNENGTLAYKQGEVLRGNVEITLKKVKKFKGFNILVYGRAKTSIIKERETLLGDTIITNYLGTEPLLDAKLPLFGKCVLQPGTYKFEFCLPLPHDLPYSLKIRTSSIRYFIKAEFFAPRRKTECKTDLKIIQNDDLNLYPELKMPVRCSGEKSFFSLLCFQNSLHMDATMPCKGFAIDQFAPITINYKNDSTVGINETVIELIREAVFIFPSEKKPRKEKHEKLIFKIKTEGVAAMSSKTIQSGITIPNVYASNNKSCHIISIQYFIEIVAKPGWMRADKRLRLPITIGDIPLNFDMTQPSNVFALY